MKNLSIVLLLIFSTSLILAQKNNALELEVVKPFVLGEIVDIQSKTLDEKRSLNIYLPEGYNKSDTIKYPVIYLLDGSADEDFIHIVGLVQFNSFEWINQIPKSIVVGISSVDRRRDFTFPTTIQEDKRRFPTTGGSNKFISFIQNELQPFIDAKFKTTKDRTIIGQSLGGLLATEILLKRPMLFYKYIIVSPSLRWNNGSLLNQNSGIFSDSFNQSTEIYIGVGKEGLAPTKMPHVMEVEANVLADKLSQTKSKNVKVYFDYLPQENHATIMHQAVSNSFRLLYKKVPKE